MTPEEKLQVEVLQKDLAAYQKMETWGSSLFLGAIALFAKQLIEWDKAAGANRIVLEPWAFLAPALIGVVAFVFLRVVNFRGTRTSMKLWRRVFPALPSNRISWGILGLLLAVMPLALGYVVSWLLVQGHSARETAMSWAWCLGAISLVVSLVAHIVIRCRAARGDTSNGLAKKEGGGLTSVAQEKT